MEDNIDNLLLKNRKYRWKIIQEVENIELDGKIPKYPILILTCMDPRIDVHRIFQLEPGDVFVLRNAGNIYTKDVLRSVLIAIHEHGIKNIIVLGHLNCGMKKLHPREFQEKLNPPTLKMIGRGGTNFYFELQKFFKFFKDELKNVENQVQRFLDSKEIPSNVKIKGMIYDPESGWVIGEEQFSKYSFYENFAKDYRAIMQEKEFELIEYIETIEDQIIGEVDLKKVDETELVIEKVEEHEEFEIKEAEDFNKLAEVNIDTNMNDSEDKVFQNNQIRIPRIQIQKIPIPKIKIHVPNIYRKKEIKK